MKNITQNITSVKPGGSLPLPIERKPQDLRHSATDSTITAKTAADKCGTYAIITEDISGQHHFAKLLLCGKEWCPVCGENGSKAHNRRIARWLPKFQQISQFGYFVIEFPDRYRKDVTLAYSKKGLQDTTNKVVQVLAGKRQGRKGRVGGYFDRGLIRWHWYGDYAGLIGGVKVNLDDLGTAHAEAFEHLISALVEMGIMDILISTKGNHTIFFDNPGGELTYIINRLVTNFAKCYGFHIKPYHSIKINQHMNAGVVGGYMETDQLEEIKAKLREALNCPDLIVHYGYFEEPAQIYHKLKYITRATFRNYDWNPYMANQLFNFRNSRWWGKWEDPPAWVLDKNVEDDAESLHAAELIGRGICPECGDPLKPWSRPIPSKYLEAWGAVELGNTGYYQIPHKEYYGSGLSPGAVLRLQKLEDQVKDKPSVDLRHIDNHDLEYIAATTKDNGLYMTIKHYLLEDDDDGNYL